MVQETILQHWIFSSFALPFLLVFFIVFGILEKAKFFGEGKKQLHALVAFVIGLIFIGAVSPKLVVENLILFLVVAMVTMFVGLLLWGFIAGEAGLKFDDAPRPLKIFIGVVIAIAVLFGLLWAAGVPGTIVYNAMDYLFRNEWSTNFWTNVIFVVLIIAALALVLKDKKKAG